MGCCSYFDTIRACVASTSSPWACVAIIVKRSCQHRRMQTSAVPPIPPPLLPSFSVPRPYTPQPFSFNAPVLPSAPPSLLLLLRPLSFLSSLPPCLWGGRVGGCCGRNICGEMLGPLGEYDYLPMGPESPTPALGACMRGCRFAIAKFYG